MSAIRTFGQLVGEVMAYLDQAGETGTTRDVVEDTIRRVHTSRVTERKWNFMLWSEPVTLTTVIGQRLYSLHSEFFRPQYFFNRTAKRTLIQATEQSLLSGLASMSFDFDTAGGGTDWTQSTGPASRYKFSGVSPVATQPTSASVLTVTGQVAKTITVRGMTTDGIQSETITVGTPGSVSFTKILGLSKGDGWTSTLTLSAGATTLVKLFADEYGREHRQFELLTTPSSAETIYYQFYRKPSPLSNDNDIPDIPSEFSRLLVYDGLLNLGAYNANLSGASMKLWQYEQGRLETGLIEYDAGTDAVNAESSYINYIQRD